ncbi:MAG: TolC family protein [Fibrobacterota bacterium]
MMERFGLFLGVLSAGCFFSASSAITLEAYIDSVYAHSPAIQAASLKQREWQARREAFRRSLYPQVVIDGEYRHMGQWQNRIPGYEHRSMYNEYVSHASYISESGRLLSQLMDRRFRTLTEDGPDNLLLMNLRIEQILPIQDSRLDELRSIETETRYRICEWQHVQMQEKLRATKLFYTLLLADRRIAILRKRLGNERAAHTECVALFSKGLRDEYDTLKSYLGRADIAAELAREKSARRNTAHRFVSLADLAVSPDSARAEGELSPQKYEIPYDLLKEKTLHDNKRIRKVEIARDIAGHRLAGVRKERFPTVSAGLDFTRNVYFDAPKNAFSRPDKSAFIKMNWPLFTFGSRRENVTVHRLQKRTAQLELERVREEVLLDLRQAWLEYQQSTAALKEYEAAVAAAEKARAVATRRSSAGLIPPRELQRMEESVMEHRLSRAEAMYRQNMAVVRIRLIVADYLYKTKPQGE